PPLVRSSIDPEVARWTSLPDVEMGLTGSSLALLAVPYGCDEVRRRAGALGNAFFPMERRFEALGADPPPDAGVPALDESSPPALIASVQALEAWGVPLSSDEERRLAGELGTMRDAERSSLGRARLAMAAGGLWLGSDSERAQAALLLSLRE